MNEALPEEIPFHEQLLAESRAHIALASEPSHRLSRLVGAVHAGDVELAPQAVSCLDELPERDAPLWSKMVVAALAEQGLFTEADGIIRRLWDVDTKIAMEATCTVVAAGHAGADDQHLNLDPTIFGDFVVKGLPKDMGASLDGVDFSHPDAWGHVQLRETLLSGFDSLIPAGTPIYKLQPRIYLESLATYGLDLSDTSSSGGRLFAHFLASFPVPYHRDQMKKSIIFAGVSNGHVDQALRLKDSVKDPYLLASASAKIANAAAERGREDAKALALQASTAIESALALEDTALGDTLGQHKEYLRYAIMDASEALARSGEATAALDLMQQMSLLYPDLDDAARTYHLSRGGLCAIFYEQTGSPSWRAAALLSASEGIDMSNPESAKVIRAIALAEMKWGLTVDSPLGDGEIVPRICDEVRRRIFPLVADMDTPPDQVIEEFSKLFSDYRDQYHWKIEGRDKILTILAAVLAEVGAPRTAEKIIEGIVRPADKFHSRVSLAIALRKQQGPTSHDVASNSTASSTMPSTSQEVIGSACIGDIKNDVNGQIESLSTAIDSSSVVRNIDASLLLLSGVGITPANQNIYTQLELAKTRAENVLEAVTVAVDALRRYLELL